MVNDIKVKTINVPGSPYVDGVDVMLDRDKLIFWARVGKRRIESSDINKIITNTRSAMLGDVDVTWIPSIEAALRDYSANGAVTLHIKRLIVGVKPDGDTLAVPWTVSPKGRGPIQMIDAPHEVRVLHSGWFAWNDTSPRFAPPIRALDYTGEPNNVWYFPYDEWLWNRLNIVRDHLDQMHERLVELLDTEDGRRALANGTAFTFFTAGPVPKGR